MIQKSYSWTYIGENSNSERYMNPNVPSSTIYNSQDKEATEVSIDRWMGKEDVWQIQNGILPSQKRMNSAMQHGWT